MTRRLSPPGRGALAFHLTEEHPCAYLPGRQARTLFLDPAAPLGGDLYQELIDQGFRRSGRYVYRPACRGCRGCIPVRLPVADFTPDRSQRRNWRRNAPEIALRVQPARFDPEHFALYRRYLKVRHPDGIMSGEADESGYRRFLIEPWGGTTSLIELRLSGRLVGVAVTDLIARGLSAVYTFYEPQLQARALGTFAILAQIEIAKRLNLPYLYLGYWIADSPKMAYKSRFRPTEAWDGGGWRRFERGQPLIL